MGGSYGVQGITLKDLEATPPSEAYKFLEKLGAHMSPDAEIVIMICSVADESDGKKFIRLMAQITKHKVCAWDDWIFVTPSGQEWIAKPDGTREAGKVVSTIQGDAALLPMDFPRRRKVSVERGKNRNQGGH